MSTASPRNHHHACDGPAVAAACGAAAASAAGGAAVAVELAVDALPVANNLPEIGPLTALDVGLGGGMTRHALVLVSWPSVAT